MTLCATVGESSGRAKCKLCGKLIALDQKQIRLWGYQTSASIHNEPKDCIKGRR